MYEKGLQSDYILNLLTFKKLWVGLYSMAEKSTYSALILECRYSS